MPKYLSNLTKSRIIDSVTLVDLKKEVDLASFKEKSEVKKMLSQVEVYRIAYKVGRLRVIGYVVIPQKGKNLPCLIHLRGGTREFAMLTPRVIFSQMVKYAVEGYVVISTQYPGVEGGSGADTWGGRDDLDSIKKLKNILSVIPIANSKAIGIKGHSRGGLMAYMMLKEVRWIKAAVIGSAPTNEIRAAKERVGWRKHQISLWGKSQKETIKRSPIYWAGKLSKKVPILIMHGSSDWRVSPLDSIDMCRKLYTYSVPHRFIFFEGADHSITEYKDVYFTQTLRWFNRFLKDKAPMLNLRPHGS